jgi:hypothetical protein
VLEFDAGVLRGESPVGLGVFFVALSLPSGNLLGKGLSKNKIYNYFIGSNIWRYRVIPITVKFVT